MTARPCYATLNLRRIDRYRIEERGLEFRPTDELACRRNEYQEEIAASEGIAMALLTANHPPLRIGKRRGPFPIADNQIENEVFHRNEVERANAASGENSDVRLTNLCQVLMVEIPSPRQSRRIKRCAVRVY